MSNTENMMATEALTRVANRLEDAARVSSAHGDLINANALHAGAMALASLARRAADPGRCEDIVRDDLDRRAALAALEFAMGAARRTGEQTE